MSKPTYEVIERYKKKAYDRMSFMFKKGKKDLIKKRADSLGLSMNAYINALIDEDLKNL